MAKELQVSLPPRLSEVRRLSQMVEEFGDANRLPETKIYFVNLALDELINNTVTHGLQNAADPRIDVSLRIHGGILTLTLTDNGAPFDPTRDSRPDTESPLESRPVGGLGLHLVKNFADRIAYEYVDGENRLTVEHDLDSAAD